MRSARLGKDEIPSSHSNWGVKKEKESLDEARYVRQE